MELAFAAMADHASIDRGGKMSVIGVFDTIWARDLPVQHRAFAFVTRFRIEHEDQNSHHTVQLTIIDEDSQPLFRAQGELNVGRIPPGGFTHADQIFNIQDLRFENYGRYRFRVELDDDEGRRHDTVFQVAKLNT